MKISLATIHAYTRSLPLALLYLKANLVEHHGCALEDVAIEELPKDASTGDRVTQILSSQPRVVGLSCYIWNGRALLDVAKELRARDPGILIVLGGPEVGPVAHEVLQAEPYIDAIVRSEGEVPFAQVVDAVRDGRAFDDICGICFRRGDSVVDTPDATILRDLNLLPSPHQEKYITFTGRVASIETQRGCVFRCSFCFYNKDLSIRNRRFDIDRVKEELLFWLNHDVHSIYLMDPVFNLNAARAKEICRFIAQHNHRKIKVHSEIWAEFMDDELAALMADANFYWLEVGLQTTDDTTLAAVERRLRLAPFLEGIEHIKRHKIQFELQLILGLPSETPATFRRSIDFAARLEPPELSVFTLLVLPGTELWKKAQSFGLEFDPNPPYEVRANQSMDAAMVAAGRRFADAVHYMYKSKTMRLLQREPGVSMSIIADAWVEFRGERSLSDMNGHDLRRFVAGVCKTHAIPSVFYEAMIAMEYPPGAAGPDSGAMGQSPRTFPEPVVIGDFGIGGVYNGG